MPLVPLQREVGGAVPREYASLCRDLGADEQAKCGARLGRLFKRTRHEIDGLTRPWFDTSRCL